MSAKIDQGRTAKQISHQQDSSVNLDESPKTWNGRVINREVNIIKKLPLNNNNAQACSPALDDSEQINKIKALWEIAVKSPHDITKKTSALMNMIRCLKLFKSSSPSTSPVTHQRFSTQITGEDFRHLGPKKIKTSADHECIRGCVQSFLINLNDKKPFKDRGFIFHQLSDPSDEQIFTIEGYKSFLTKIIDLMQKNLSSINRANTKLKDINECIEIISLDKHSNDQTHLFNDLAFKLGLGRDVLTAKALNYINNHLLKGYASLTLNLSVLTYFELRTKEMIAIFEKMLVNLDLYGKFSENSHYEEDQDKRKRSRSKNSADNPNDWSESPSSSSFIRLRSPSLSHPLPIIPNQNSLADLRRHTESGDLSSPSISPTSPLQKAFRSISTSEVISSEEKIQNMINEKLKRLDDIWFSAIMQEEVHEVVDTLLEKLDVYLKQKMPVNPDSPIEKQISPLIIDDFKTYFLNLHEKHSEQHEKIVKCLENYLLDLTQPLPGSGKKGPLDSEIKLEKWMEQKVSDIPVVNLFFYFHAINQLIKCIEIKKECLIFSEAFHQDDDFYHHPKIIKIMKDIDQCLREEWGGQEKQEEYFKERYTQIIESLKYISQLVSFKIAEEFKHTKSLEKNWRTNLYALHTNPDEIVKKTLISFPRENSLGMLGKLLVVPGQMMNAGKPTEWQYILRDGLFEIRQFKKNKTKILFDGKKVADQLNEKNSQKIKKSLMDILGLLVNQLSLGDNKEIKDLIASVDKIMVSKNDDLTTVCEKIIGFFCQELYKMEEKGEKENKSLKILLLLKLLNQDFAFAYVTKHINGIHQQITSQQLLNTLKPEKNERPNKSFKISFTPNQVTCHVEGSSNVGICDLRNVVNVRERVVLTASLDQMLNPKAWIEKNHVTIVYNKSLDKIPEAVKKAVKKHLEILKIELAMVGFYFDEEFLEN